MASTDAGLGSRASVGLRAGGGVAELVFGTLGVALPFVLRRLRDGAPWLLYTKAAAAGVVLSLALVHLINDAFSTFAELEPGAPLLPRRMCRARLCLRPRCAVSARPPRRLRASLRALFALIGAAASNARRGVAAAADASAPRLPVST